MSTNIYPVAGVVVHGPFSILVMLEVAVACDMRLEAFVKIVRAPTGDQDGDEKEQDSNDGEHGQGPPGGEIVFSPLRVGTVHANELEDKVGEGAEVDKLLCDVG